MADIDIKEVAKWLGFGALGYVALNYVVFRSVDAVDYWEAKGYLNGLVRGSGSKASAQTNLESWKSYWVSQGAPSFIVNPLYNYGVSRIGAVYG